MSYLEPVTLTVTTDNMLFYTDCFCFTDAELALFLSVMERFVAEQRRLLELERTAGPSSPLSV